MNDKKSSLADTLVNLGYAQLFHLDPAEYLNPLWEKTGTPGALQAMVEDTDEEKLPRLLAAEVIFLMDEQAWKKFDAEQLAEIYVSALQGSAGSPSAYGVYGNSWGFMAYLESQGLDGTGPLGKRLLAIGTPALKPLRALLEDENILWYEGSKEATVGNGLQIRVKDAAAYFIAMINGFEVRHAESHAGRDEMIREMLAQMDN